MAAAELGGRNSGSPPRRVEVAILSVDRLRAGPNSCAGSASELDSLWRFSLSRVCPIIGGEIKRVWGSR